MRRLALVVTGLLALASAPAHAGDQAAPIDPASRMMLVLDSSGSMAEETPDGTPRIDAAKDALRRVIAKLPTEQEVGLRVYGAEVFSRGDEGACTDSQLIVEPSTDNRDDLTGALEGYRPYGETPIGHALREAGKDLGSEGPRTIVLVSDGEPTCDPDPCKVAADLTESGIDVRIDVIGLDVAGDARDKLRCVAEKGHGTYYDVASADELVRSLDVSTTRASRPFDLTGTPVEGTATPADAPTVGTGQYLDAFPAGDGDLWYRVERTTPGSTIHVGAAHRAAQIGNSGPKVGVATYHDPNSVACRSASSFARGSIGYTGTSSWSPRQEACATAEILYVKIDQMSKPDELANSPLEIAVYEEPPLADPAASSQIDPQQPAWEPLIPGTPVEGVVPGTSISNAPLVDDGSYHFDVNPGETQSVAIPLDWGQDLQAQLDADVTRAGPVDHAGPEIQVVGALRQKVGGDYTDSALSQDWTPYYSLPTGQSEYRWGRQAFAVAFDNRHETEEWWQGSALPGLRYVLVSLPKEAAAPASYTLTLRTNGTAGEGAPAYAEADGLTTPTANLALTADGTSTAEAIDDETTQTDSSDSDSEKTESRAPNRGNSVPWLPISLGATGLLALAGAAGLVVRSRRGGATEGR